MDLSVLSGDPPLYRIDEFSLADMTRCSAEIRRLGLHASSMEEASNRVVRYFYDTFTEHGDRSFALVRLFKTHGWGELDEDRRRFCERFLQGVAPSEHLRCLTLLATAGLRPEWNDWRQSGGHQAIPLVSEETVASAPMIASLLGQVGVDVSAIVRPHPDLILDLSQKTFNVFHVPEAAGSPFIPAQHEFVERDAIRSVLGFGGVLPGGSFFAVIFFSRSFIPRTTAEMFKPLALSTKMALLPLERSVFACV